MKKRKKFALILHYGVDAFALLVIPLMFFSLHYDVKIEH